MARMLYTMRGTAGVRGSLQMVEHVHASRAHSSALTHHLDKVGCAGSVQASPVPGPGADLGHRGAVLDELVAPKSELAARRVAILNGLYEILFVAGNANFSACTSLHDRYVWC